MLRAWLLCCFYALEKREPLKWMACQYPCTSALVLYSFILFLYSVSLSLLILFAVLNFAFTWSLSALHSLTCLSKQSWWWQNSKLSFLLSRIQVVNFYPCISCSLSLSASPGFLSFEPGDPQRSEKLQHSFDNGWHCQVLCPLSRVGFLGQAQHSWDAGVGLLPSDGQFPKSGACGSARTVLLRAAAMCRGVWRGAGCQE